MSEIRVTSVVGENGGDRVGLTTGLTVGPLTGTTGIGATITHQGHAQFAGVCTASSFAGNVNTDKIIPTGGVPSGGGGGIIQVLQGSTNNRLETSSQSFVATNLSATITPKFNTSKVFIMISGDCNTNAVDNEMYMSIYRSIGGASFSDLGSGSGHGFATASSYSERLHSAVSINYLDSPSTTSSVEYKVYVRKSNTGSGNVEFPVNNGAQHAFITLMEVSG